ncbi:uncharacterized protein LOC144158238 isoform X3 [Haemaphysalis longicornis]
MTPRIRSGNPRPYNRAIGRRTTALTWGTTPTTGATLTSSTAKICAVAMSVYAASNKDVFCSHKKTQTTITTNAKGAQCALTFFISASSQTEKKFPGLGNLCTSSHASL